MTRILLTGATSAIAQEAAKRFAADGASFLLAARDAQKLESVAADLRARGAERVEITKIDFIDLDRCPHLVEEAQQRLGGLDVLLVAQGTLPDQARCEVEVNAALREVALNTLSVIALLIPAAKHFEAQGSGCLAVITSVAGVRGRRSNYVYGSAKAAVSVFLEGLRARMAAFDVAVVDVRPGFVDTPMTAHLPKNFLFASAQQVGDRVYRAIRKREDVVYTPWFWRWIALLILLIPRRVFKKLKF